MNTTSKTSEEIQNSFNEILSITSEQERIELEAQSLAFSFLAEIDKVMSEQQMSKKRLAASIGTSASYITQLFRGDRMPNFLNLAKMKEALGMDIPPNNTRFTHGIAQNYGYMGLYNGLVAKDIQAKKGLMKSQNILDHMGSAELAANLFRATQTEDKLRRDKIKSKQNTNKTHFEVGQKVRQTIMELGGTMPEDFL